MPPKPTTAVGANVRAEMARHSVTQMQLAAHMGLSQASISARLRGQVAFDVNELVSIAAFLQVSVGALLPSDVAA